MLLITDDWITIVEGLQADPTTLSVADFDNAGSVNLPTEGIDSGSRKDITSVTTSAYNAFTLNNTGRSWISLSDYSTFALREGHDVLDIAYDGPASTQNSLTFRANEFTGTSSDPILEVTYTQPITILTDEVDYAYDHAMRRVSKTKDSTTLYPSLDYSVEGTTTTVYVSGPSGLVAQVEDNGTITTTQTLHTDHLGSTSVVTDEDGIMVELLDYHPYGSERSSWSLTAEEAETDKTYIGEYSDDETGLSYLNARYYDPGRGGFLVQDVVFVNIGVDRRTELALLNPQLLNAYAYGADNPIRNTDKEGEFLDVLADIAFIAYDTYRVVDAALTGGDVGREATALGADAMGALIPGATGLGLSVRGVDKVGDVVKAVDRMSEVRSIGKAGETAAGIQKNSERIPSLTDTATFRIPDGLDHQKKILQEVKNTIYQPLTNQLKDFIGYTQKEGYTFDLFVRPDTQLSRPLQDVAESGVVNIKRSLD